LFSRPWPCWLSILRIFIGKNIKKISHEARSDAGGSMPANERAFSEAAGE
jgi:hypothetical protein